MGDSFEVKFLIIGTGIDIIEVERIAGAYRKERFAQRVFTPRERQFFLERGDNPQTIAGSFAAKEAVSKALGTGFGKIGWREVEILRNEKGAPYAVLHGKALEEMRRIGGDRVWISISHDRKFAVAQAIIEG